MTAEQSDPPSSEPEPERGPEDSETTILGSREVTAMAEEIAEEILEGVVMDEEVRDELQGRLEMVVAQFQSPVPPPFIMRDYAEVLPSAPERIFALAEQQSAHRQRLERKVVDGGSRRADIGQIFALVIALTFGFFSYDLIKNDHELAGAFLGTVDLVALVTVFLTGRGRQEKTADRSEQETRPPAE